MSYTKNSEGYQTPWGVPVGVSYIQARPWLFIKNQTTHIGQLVSAWTGRLGFLNTIPGIAGIFERAVVEQVASQYRHHTDSLLKLRGRLELVCDMASNMSRLTSSSSSSLLNLRKVN